MTQTESQGHCPMDDASILEHALELVAQRRDDIGPEVYSHFFQVCPAQYPVFKVVDPKQPPHGCGQMLFEVLSLLQDSTSGKSYVPSYLQQIAAEHAAFGVHGSVPYREFLDSLVAVVARVVGDDWTQAHAAAWARQTAALVRHLAPLR